MSLKYNGTDVKKIVYNGTELTKVIYNGTAVWESGSWNTVWKGSSSLSSSSSTFNFYPKKGKVRLTIDGYYSGTHQNYIEIDSSKTMAGEQTIYGIRYSMIAPDGFPDNIGTIKYQLYDNDAADRLTGISIAFYSKDSTYTATLKFVEVYY